MVNEERLRQMIKTSKFDTNDGKKCKPMIQYTKKDYVSLQLLKGFVSGTACFALLLGLWGLYSMEDLLEEINKLDLGVLLLTLLAFYIGFMLIYLIATYIIYNMKYSEGRRKVKKYYGNIKRINQMYGREERQKTPNGSWD